MTATGISGLQQIECFSLAAKVRVAGLWQVPGPVEHVLTLRKADLLQIVWRRPSGREAIQPVAPHTSPSLLAVTGWIPSPGLRRELVCQGGWLLLFLPGPDNLLLRLDRWVYFLLFNGDAGRGLLLLQGDGFLRESRSRFVYIRAQESEPLFLIHRDVFWGGRGLHFSLFLKEGRVMQRGCRVVYPEPLGLWWGRGCCIAYFTEVLEEGLWLHLSLV